MRTAQRYVEEGKGWAVDIDIERFFDTLNQDLLMDRVALVIGDKRILRLIGRYLRAGALVGAEWEPSEAGTPQGGPMSPLLGNIYLDALDRELAGRGLSFCRYADDCNIDLSSESAAERVEAAVGEWIERRLRFRVNRAKSGRGRPWGRRFLGLAIDREGRIRLAERSLERYKRKVRELWRGGQALTSTQLRDRWRSWLQGWRSYFELAENRARLERLEGWMRRHIRKRFWLRWHETAGRKNALRRLGVRERLLLVVSTRRGWWFMARNTAVQGGLSNARLKRYGFLGSITACEPARSPAATVARAFQKPAGSAFEPTFSEEQGLVAADPGLKGAECEALGFCPFLEIEYLLPIRW